MDLAVTWPNKFLSGEFRRKMVKIWSDPWVMRLLGRITSLLENFMFFTENGHLYLWVSPWKFVSNVKCGRMKLVQYVLWTGLFPSGKMVRNLCFKKNTSMMEFVRVG